MIQLSKKIALAAALGALLTLPTVAKAGFVPVLTSPPQGGSSTVFNYTLSFSASLGATLTSGDFLTLYDFDAGITTANVGTQVVIVGPAGLTASSQPFGTTPPPGQVTPTDTAINNITFTYNGVTLGAGATWTVSITLIGGLYTTRVGQYTSTDTGVLPGDNQQIGPVLLPTLVPEPTSVALLGLGTLGLGLVARRRMARA